MFPHGKWTPGTLLILFSPFSVGYGFVSREAYWVSCVQYDCSGSRYLTGSKYWKTKVNYEGVLEQLKSEHCSQQLSKPRPQIVTRIIILIVNMHAIKGFRSWNRLEYKTRALSELIPFIVLATIFLSDMGSFKNTSVDIHQEWLIFLLKWP